MYSAIIFDLDGTLVDSYPGIHQSLNETLSALQLPEVDLSTVKRMVGRGVENLMRQVAGDRWQEALQIFRVSYDRTHLSGTSLLSDVKRTLEELQKRGTLMAVATNKLPDYTRNILKHLEIDPYFAEVAGPDGTIQPKPHPSMLTELIERMHARTDQTLYVGDMALDVETARNANVAVALIPGGGGTLEELRAAKPDHLLQNFSELPSISAAFR